MSDFAHALNAEIASLEQELHADPRFVKLEELKKVLTLYVGGPTKVMAAPVRKAFPYNADMRRRMSRNAATIQAAVACLKEGRGPVITSVILDRLTEQGVHVEAKDPRNALSAMMTHSKRFVSHGRRGWTLKGARPTGNAEAVDANPAQGTSTASNEPRLTTEETKGLFSEPAPADRVKPWSGGGT